MRIRSLSLTRFGPIAGARFAFEPGVTVVHGPNEAGKSSLHQAIETVLYGFSPANRELHPFAQWEDEDEVLELGATLERGDGTPVAVRRSLRTTPMISIAESEDELGSARRGNQALPGLEAQPRGLFRAVYSLTANDTIFQRDEVRDHVSNLLLGERALEGARPIREVRATLAVDIGKLWRPNDRGKPKSKLLRAELREAQKTEREARKRERSLREEAIEQAELLAERDALVGRRDALRRLEGEVDFLGKIAELRGRMDAVMPLRTDALTGGSMEDPEPLREELAALRAELCEPRRRLAAELARLPLLQRMLLARADAVERILREAARDAADREAWSSARERAQGAVRTATERLQRAGNPDPDLARYQDLDLAPLEAAQLAWQQDVVQQGGRVPSATPARLLAVVALGCVVLAATGLAQPWIALGALAAVPMFLRRDRDLHRTPAPEGLATLLVEADLPAMESPLMLRKALGDLDDARTLLAEAHRERATGARLEAQLLEREEEWKRVADGVLDGDFSIQEIPARFEQALGAARAAQAELKRTHAQRERDEQQVAAHLPRERRLAKRLASLDEVLDDHFPTLDPERAYAAWREVEAELEYVRRRERELREDARWEALSLDERLELVGDARPWCAAAREERAEELTRVDERLEEVRERRGAIGAHLDGDSGGAVAVAAERAAELEEELESTHVERDRLALLERVLVVAERAHREAHQPKVLLRAGEYLSVITSGRYTGLSYPEGQQGSLFVQPSDRDEPVAVDPPLSRGTREQIYLCLRLGTLDALDEDRERLPLVLDEALVHWDQERREAFYGAIREVAGRRQVLLFTCHDGLAKEAEAALGAARIDLGEGVVRS